MRIFVAVAAMLACSVAAQAEAADKKQAPACAAISFRPLAGAMNDGPATAGHYRSRFGAIDLIGDVKGGQASYAVRVNNKPLKPLQGDIPKGVYPCLTSKHIKTPPQPIGGVCTGSRFRVAVDSSTKQKLVMLFALQGDDWKLCEAGTP
jgi:opacity protein-like surface antigen